jgi:hypothetical protein
MDYSLPSAFSLCAMRSALCESFADPISHVRDPQSQIQALTSDLYLLQQMTAQPNDLMTAKPYDTLAAVCQLLAAYYVFGGGPTASSIIAPCCSL